jgi:predicted chitinase
MNFYYGVVENRIDPLQLGRCQVRVVGLHTHDKSQLPTADLPWAHPMQPVTSAAMNGIGSSPIGPVEGTSVIVIFADDNHQQPIMIGTVGGIPSVPAPIDADDNTPITSTLKVEKILLRTIPGPTTGVQLTFYDPEYGSTNLTKDLKPNMKVVAFGIPAEATIVSIDSGTKITISKPVLKYEENIVTFEAAPSNLEAIQNTKVNDFLNSINPFAPKDTLKKTPVNSSIPTVPPPKESPNPSLSTQGIKALLAAADKVGLTTKEQKCALLGICGGESRWITPNDENYQYVKPTYLKQIFSFATDAEAEKYSNAKKKGLTRYEFFSWAYGPNGNGKLLGNKTNDEGGKYYGRGYIQLTGKPNYERFQKEAAKYGYNLNIVNDPESINTDINAAAVIAALFLKLNVPSGVSASAHPGYFLAAKAKVGNNTAAIAALKKSYYEYFYGYTSDVGAEKDAGPAKIESPPVGIVTLPQPSSESVKTGSDTIGFRDPNNKYPLKDYVGEPDTNRLARGIIEGTVLKKKDALRKRTVPKANNGGVWDQPEAAYGAQYPYNKVLETEAGHVQEFDDTPGYERIHTYHRSGTFSEIDPSGSQINYIIGDNYIIMDKNGCVSVAGELNITVEGNTNIYARNEANVQVAGSATVNVGNTLTVGVFSDVNMAVGGNFNLKVAGNYNLQAANINQLANNYHSISAKEYTLASSGSINMLGSSKFNLQSSGSMDLKVGGTLSADYTQGQFGNGAAGTETVVVQPVTLTPPEIGVPTFKSIPFEVPKERSFEEKAGAETPDDYDTAEGRRLLNKQQTKEGVETPAPIVAVEEAPPTKGKKSSIPVDCQIIYNTKNFTNDFRMSTNFVLGMLMDGGVGGKHKLVDQMLKDTKTGPDKLYTVSQIVCSLAQTCQNILEPALKVLPRGIDGLNKTWTINSGYRLRGLTKNESPTSDHCKGRAFDIGTMPKTGDIQQFKRNYDLILQLEKLLPYDQLILEYQYPGTCWIHVSFNPNSTRKQAFTMVNHQTYKGNINGGFVLLDSIPAPAKKT